MTDTTKLADGPATPVNPVPARAGYAAASANDPDARPTDDSTAKQEKAAFARAAKKQHDDEEETRLAGERQKAGLAAAGVQPDTMPGKTDTAPLPKLDMSGKGWIYCGPDAKGRGTWICDKGDEIKVPFSKSLGMSPGQKQMIHNLAAQKGWDQVYAFNPGGFGLHTRGTNELVSSGFNCCTKAKGAPSLHECKAHYRAACEEHHKHACAAQASQMKLQA